MAAKHILSVHASYLRTKGNHYDLTQTDHCSAIRCLVGSYRSFATSLQVPVPYGDETFAEALSKAYIDFRSAYLRQYHTDYKGTDESIISRYAQIFLAPSGTATVFTYGGSRVTLLRHHLVVAPDKNQYSCQPGDIFVINLEGESMTQRLIESGTSELSKSDYPSLVSEVVAWAEPKQVPEIKPVTPTLQKEVPEVEAHPETPDDPQAGQGTPALPEIPEVYTTQFHRVGKPVALVFLLLVLGIVSWLGYSSSSFRIIPEGFSFSRTFLPVDTAGNGIAVSETTSQSYFPKTDSLFALYLNNNPRDLALLDQVIVSLDREKQKHPEEAKRMQQDLKREQQEVVRQLSLDFNELLNKAQLALEEGNLEKAETLLEEADLFYQTVFPAESRKEPQINRLQANLQDRRKHLESFKNTDF